jgi:hypothetical protein
MPTFLFSYRIPKADRPDVPQAMEAWNDWFDRLGAAVVDRGDPVFESSTLGDCRPDATLGGYSIVSADDLDAAVALAEGCPALAHGAGVEIGVLTPTSG